jgi:hypothetical protein
MRILTKTLAPPAVEPGVDRGLSHGPEPSANDSSRVCCLLGVAGAPRKRRGLDDIAGTWKADKALESALAAQDRVDKDLWR